MKVTKTTLEEREALIEKSRKKLQALLNYGFEILSTNKTPYNVANQIAKELENNETFTLTMPMNKCLCLQVSDMALKLLKPYLKDLLHVGQIATKTNYILFSYDVDIIEQLAPLTESNEHIQLVDTFEMSFNKYTLPNYKNTAKLYDLKSAPVLTNKEVKKILELHHKIINSLESYFLLSSNVSHSYNMPMTVLRKLGDNVISLKALNVLEILMVFTTNSSAIYRQPNEEIKPLIIPVDFFNFEDFDLNQTNDEILSSLKELKSIGLINNFKTIENAFKVESNVIVKSIKQYSYKQNIGYYRNLCLHQQNYVYTFINYVRYVKNIKHTEIIEDLNGNKTKKEIKAESLTITLEGLIYNLELEDYIHDHTYLADILNNLREVGIQRLLLVPTPNAKPIIKEDVKYLLSHRDKLHEFFKLNIKEDKVQDTKGNVPLTSSFYNPNVSTEGRTLINNR